MFYVGYNCNNRHNGKQPWEKFRNSKFLTPLPQKKKKRTYKSDAMSWRGAQCPGAGLFAGILVRPVGASDGARHPCENLITAS